MDVKFTATTVLVVCGLIATTIPSNAISAGSTPAFPKFPTPPAAAASESDDNPYAVIVEKNVFHLQAAPLPKVVEEKPVDIPKVSLNGILNIGDEVRVLFSIPPKDAKSQVQYFKLAPGEKVEPIELVKIHPDQKGVDIIVSGTPVSLAMNTNTSSGGGGPAPAGPATAAIAPNGSSAIVVGGRGSSPYGNVAVGGGGGSVTVIGGNSGGGVAVAGGANYSPSSGGGAGLSSPTSATGQIPAALLSGAAPSPIQYGNPTPTQVIPPEQQALNLAAQYTLGKAQGTPLPPLPPDVAEQLGDSSSSQPPPLPGQK